MPKWESTKPPFVASGQNITGEQTRIETTFFSRVSGTDAALTYRLILAVYIESENSSEVKRRWVAVR
jgi:hypothetical protein